MSTEADQQLVPVEVPVEWNQANNVAKLCRDVVKGTAMKIGESLHVPIEGWQTVAAAYGCTPGTEEPYKVEGGWRCKAILKRDSDGAILSTAYGYVGEDESLWMDRKQYTREGMVQTRAMSRVCANKFKFVVTLMKIEGLKTTPAEEMVSGEKPKGYTETVGVLKDITFERGYWNCFIAHKRHWTQEPGTGALLDKYKGVEVLAKSVEVVSKKEGKPNSFRILSIEPIVSEVPLPEEFDDIST